MKIGVPYQKNVKMNKAALGKIAQDYMRRNKVEKVYATEDGTLFLKPNPANSHKNTVGGEVHELVLDIEAEAKAQAAKEAKEAEAKAQAERQPKKLKHKKEENNVTRY